MSSSAFNIQHTLHKLRHYLPAQAPLKDFIHHNTLHAFQDKPFFQALAEARALFGYKTLLSLAEYRNLYHDGRIREDILDHVLRSRVGDNTANWKHLLLNGELHQAPAPRIGALRGQWKAAYRVDPVSVIDPLLFRILCSYLDQGISIWNFPTKSDGLLPALRHIERNSFTSIFKTRRASALLLDETVGVERLLEILIGPVPELYEPYLIDQQFAHQGWSGMICSIESGPQSLLDQRKVTLEETIALELLLEIDLLQKMHGDGWRPLSSHVNTPPTDLFAPLEPSALDTALSIWQEAFEWSQHDPMVASLASAEKWEKEKPVKDAFQALFCIDDRECSLRRHLEAIQPACQTFGTPGFFGVEFYFQPQDGKFLTKLCPAPVTPKFLIKEVAPSANLSSDLHIANHSHSLWKGWLISQTLGFSSAIKLFLNVFRPTMGPATASSFKHMDRRGKLMVEFDPASPSDQGLQLGFKVEEMTDRVENLLRSIGLVKDFAPLVYLVGHGSSSTNNPHFAAYDCGACSGRPGSVNARVMSIMANHPSVRKLLSSRGIEIPGDTIFVGALHDTTRDEIEFFDEDHLSAGHRDRHAINARNIRSALEANAVERSKKLELVNSDKTPGWVHTKMKLRAVSLFEPRPELNHATNAWCIVGRRSLTRQLNLDRRAFLNSYDYREDPDGRYLLGILRAVAPVCGGINLEYFFSRVDNEKLGAGSKLPHNVMGLIGVANGIDGDLRPGLPAQMVEIHDPVRLLVVVEHRPEFIVEVLERSQETFDWFIQDWIHLISIHPDTRELHRLEGRNFMPYKPHSLERANAGPPTSFSSEHKTQLERAESI